MTKKKEEDLPTRDEAIRIGDWTRTRRIWKKNGNLNTLGKELNRGRQLERSVFEVLAGVQRKVRGRVNVQV